MQSLAQQHNAELVIQTIQPDHALFASLQKGAAVAHEERAGRGARDYPPYGRLITLSSKVGVIPAAVTTECRKLVPTTIGPLKTNRGVSQLILKTPQLTPALRAFLRRLPETVRVDTDPDVSS